MNTIKSCKHGVFLFNTNDTHIGQSLSEYGEYCEEEINLINTVLLPGQTAIDIGANIGTHSIAMARMVGPKGLVMSFEPQRMCYYSLCANVSLNNLTNIVCLQQAVGKEAGFVEVPELDFQQKGNFGSLELDRPYNAPGSCRVKVVTVDSLNLPKIDLIKADVEGMEADVIRGAIKSIEKHRPVLYIENDRPDRASIVLALVRALGYNVLFHVPYLYNPNNFLNNKSNYFSNTVSLNMFCVPEEKEFEIDKTKFRFQEVEDKQILIFSPDPKRAEQQVRDLKNEAVELLAHIASACSDLLHDPDEAMKYLDLAINLKDNDWKLYDKAAPILTKHLRNEQALEYNTKAIVNGGPIEVTFNRGVILDCLEKYEEALKYHEKVIRAKPDYVAAHCCRAFDLLRLERYSEGWKEFEWRLSMPTPAMKSFISMLPTHVPVWDGEESLDGKRVVLFNEQGAGDMIQFIRFAKLVKDEGGYVIITCPDNLAKICRECEWVDEVFAYANDQCLPITYEADFIVSTNSLPYLFGIKSIKPIGKYIKCVKDDNWIDMSPYEGKLKVGIVWSGNEAHQNDHNRSCFLREFSVLQSDDVQLFSLQKGNQQRNWPHLGIINLCDNAEIDMVDWTEHLVDYNRTANLINHLDLVVSVDTAVAHLAGGMGKPVYLLLGKNPDWRWGIGKKKSVWYNSISLFRDGNWSELLKEVKERLTERNVDNIY
jgi:FkbM family methyltransferase